MKINYIIGFFLISVFFTSCEVQYDTKNIDDNFTIEIPTYMVELDLGVPQAALQYGNSEDEHYIVVIRENLAELQGYGVTDLEYYASSYIEVTQASVEKAKVNRLVQEVEEHNGMNVITYEVEGIMPDNGLEMFYLIKFYESESAYYYVCDWTLADFKEEHLPAMKKITNSLKEI